MNHQTHIPQDAMVFLDELIQEMDLKTQSEAEIMLMKKDMAEILSQDLSQAVFENVRPEVIDEVMAENQEADPVMLLKKILEKSPELEQVIVNVFEHFKKDTLDAYNRLKK